MDLDIINRLYLELSQVATATTGQELKLHKGIGDARSAALNLCYEIEKLPASAQSTKLSLLASALQSHLNELLP